MRSLRRQFTILRRHFFREFLDNDLLSPGGDQHMGLLRAITVLVLLGVLLPVLKLFKYCYPYWTAVERDVQSWNDKCLFVTLSMIALSGVAVLNWDALRPNRRDQLVLGPLPIRPDTILAAKLAAFGMLLAVFALAVTGVAPFTFTFVVFAPTQSNLLDPLRFIGAHAIASLSAATFGFTAVLALQGILVVLLGPNAFRRVSAWFQFSLVFGLAIALLLLPLISNAVEPLKASRNPLMWWLPPMWFLGLYQWLGGAADPDWAVLARSSVIGVTASVALALTTQVAGYRRQVGRLLEIQDAGSRPLAPLRAIGAAVAGGLLRRRPVERGIFAFTVQTLSRNSRHRLVIAASLAAGCSLSVIVVFSSAFRSGEWGQPATDALLSVQMILAFCAVFGVRVAAAIPSDLRANWVFRLLDPGHPGPWMRGFRRAVFWCGLFPLVLLQVPVNAWWLGWRVAAAHAVVGVVLSATILEILLMGFRKVPFACSFVSGGPPKARWAFSWFGFTTFSFGLASIEARALANAPAFGWFLGAGVASLLGVVFYRNRRLGEGFAPQFDDESDWEFQTLNLTA